jgi:hypothetical protein
MDDYLKTEHERGDDPTAPLWPNRAMGGSRRPGCRAIAALDYTEPVDPGAYYKNLFRPALEAVGLLASRPAKADAPATQGVRFHDLRHTFATLLLSDGRPFMLVSEWLGHSTYTLTLDVYGGWIPTDQEAAANSLPEPTAPVKPGALPDMSSICLGDGRTSATVAAIFLLAFRHLEVVRPPFLLCMTRSSTLMFRLARVRVHAARLRHHRRILEQDW